MPPRGEDAGYEWLVRAQWGAAEAAPGAAAGEASAGEAGECGPERAGRETAQQPPAPGAPVPTGASDAVVLAWLLFNSKGAKGELDTGVPFRQLCQKAAIHFPWVWSLLIGGEGARQRQLRHVPGKVLVTWKGAYCLPVIPGNKWLARMGVATASAQNLNI